MLALWKLLCHNFVAKDTRGALHGPSVVQPACAFLICHASWQFFPAPATKHTSSTAVRRCACLVTPTLYRTIPEARPAFTVTCQKCRLHSALFCVTWTRWERACVLTVMELCCPFLCPDKDGNSHKHRVSLGVEAISFPGEGMSHGMGKTITSNGSTL